MALTKPLMAADSVYGVSSLDAYIRIHNVEFQHSVMTNRATVKVFVYHDRASYVANKMPLRVTTHICESIDHSQLANISTLLYEWLKTQNEYMGATDVLEDS